LKPQKLQFNNKRGIKLAAILDSPDNPPSSFAILCHCFTCSKDLKAYRNIDLSMTASGIAVFRFDFTGIGESGGDFSDTNFTTMIEDVLSAGEFLAGNFKAPKLTIGHSLGGCAALAAGKKLSSVNAVVTIGTPAEPSNMSIKLSKTKVRAISAGIGEAVIGGKRFKFKKQFFEDIESYKLQPVIASLHKPLLIMHSPKDNYTSVENAARIFQAAKHPKSYISLDDMDHLMLKKSDACYVGSLIAAWLKRYI
jgi:alpha-beta hydrolase superfamily lysophospholipase